MTPLRQRLAQLTSSRRRRQLRHELRNIARQCAALPTISDRREDDILGYDDRGLPR